MAEKTKNVIVALDDDTVILNSILSTLKSEYSVRPFTLARTALKYIHTNKTDLILLDYKMPAIDGLAVLGMLQENPDTKDIPVILLTGSGSGNSEVQALEMGAADYILKPIRAEVLKARIKVQLELAAHRKRLETMVEERTLDLQKSYQKLKLRESITMQLLARVTDMRDHETGYHIERTTQFVQILIDDLLAFPKEGYMLTAEEAEEIVKSAKLHDLGKISMPDHILLKTGKLTKEEFEIIKKHPVSGESLLTELIRQMPEDSFLNTARNIAYSHHEKWDGSGYPQGLAGTDIPLSARIVALADVYDALTSTRPYKVPMTHERAVAIICEGSGTHFDPYLVEVFLRHVNEFKDIVWSFLKLQHPEMEQNGRGIDLA